MAENVSETDECAALLKQIANQDRQAFTRLYQMQIKRLKNFIFKKGVNSEVIVDEICQDVFLRIWNKASAYEPNRGSGITWIVSIAQNSVYDYWRKMQRTPLGEQLEDQPETTTSSGNAHEQEDKRNTWLTVEKALSQLKDEDRDLFTMVYVQGLTLKQCAHNLGIPDGTIKWRMNKIKETLRWEVNK